MSTNCHIDYIEFGATDLVAIQEFYSAVFGWTFTVWSDSYIDFQGAGIGGGFTTDSQPGTGVLVVLFHEDIEQLQQKIIDNGGVISKEIFSFPGGERFEFTDPSGNSLAVWRKK